MKFRLFLMFIPSLIFGLLIRVLPSRARSYIIKLSSKMMGIK